MSTCRSWEKQLLLDDAGELNRRQKNRLQEHLNVCESCRRFQSDCAALSQQYSRDAEIIPMPEATRQRLVAYAESIIPAQQRPPLIWFPMSVRQSLVALAALFLIALTGLLIHRQIAVGPTIVTAAAPSEKSNEPIPEILPMNDSWEEDVIELEQSFAQVDQEWNLADTAWMPDEEAEALARNLLDMEKSS